MLEEQLTQKRGSPRGRGRAVAFSAITGRHWAKTTKRQQVHTVTVRRDGQGTTPGPFWREKNGARTSTPMHVCFRFLRASPTLSL